MPGVLGWLYDYDNKVWRPARCDDTGRMSIHAIVEELDDIEDVDLTGLADGYILYWDDASSTWMVMAIPAAAWADITGKPTAPSLEEMAAEHEGDGTHGDITPISCTLRYTDVEAVAAVKAGNYVPRTYVWFVKGTLATGDEQGATFRMKRATTVEDIELHVKTAPTGCALIVDILEEGTTLFTTKPEIDDGATVEDDNHVFSDTALAAAAELTMNIDQIGSTTPGKDLTVLLHCKEPVI